MPGNSGAGPSNPEEYAAALADMRHTMNTVPVVGSPHRDGDLMQLQRLIETYPEEARALLANRDAKNGTGSPPP